MRLPAVVLALATLPVFAAESPPAPVLRGPEVVKLDWNTRALAAHDLDGDGRTDLALINNARASIELLYQLDPAAPASAEARRKSVSATPPLSRTLWAARVSWRN